MNKLPNDQPSFVPVKQLAAAIALFPALADKDQERLLVICNSLIFFAPKSMTEPFYLGSTLMSAIACDAVGPAMIRAILDVERSYVNQAPSRMP